MGDSRKREPVVEQVSEQTTARLSVYLRCLEQLQARGVQAVSSASLAECCGLNGALIRKDLAYFGEFGVRGVGYQVATLRQHLRQILGLGVRSGVVILGAGRLGSALAAYRGFRDDGFDVVALFDTDASKLGSTTRDGVPVCALDDLPAVVSREGVTIAIIAVPADAAQDVLDRIVACGIRAVLNFSPSALRAPGDVKVKNVDLTLSLESLSFFLAAEQAG